MGSGIFTLEVAKAGLFFQQFLSFAHIAGEEHAHAQAQVVNKTIVQFGDLIHASLRELPPRVNFFVLNVDQDAFHNVADLLHVDGEADDVSPASAFVLAQGFA